MSSLPPLVDTTASRSTNVVVPGSVVTALPNSIPVSSVAAASIVADPVTSMAPVMLSTVMSRQPDVPVSSVMTGTKSASSKSKKKTGATVTMATATTAHVGSSGENTGRWTAEEHNLFLQGLELHGKGWKKIAGLIKSRTVVQIRTHAQKYFQKVGEDEDEDEGILIF